jgi:hypothetical protein
MVAKRSYAVVAGSLGASLALCRCGSTAFSPSPPLVDGGVEASLDDAPDVFIVVVTDAGGVRDASDAGCLAPTTLSCAEGCVDPTQPAHCGSCGNECSGPEAGAGYAVCEPGGLCAVACGNDSGADDGGPAEISCNSACVSPDDVGHCGTCTNVCAPPPSGKGAPTCPGALCVMTCVSGYHPGGAGCNADCLANTDDPSADSCVAADGLGVFVSPSGNDTTGDGTKEHPFGSIGHGMDTSARVYACGTFTGEQLVVSGTTRDGTSVYGGFDCATWTYTADTKTKLAPTASGFAVQVNGLMKGVTFEDFEFDSVPATTAGGSSQAALVNGSQDVTFRRCAFVAGSASLTGASGANGANTWAGIATAGNSASTTEPLVGGATQLNCTCGGSGGYGGNAGVYNANTLKVIETGGNGGAGTIGTASNGGVGAYQGSSASVACTPGTLGNPGTPGIGGTGGTSPGTVGATGWSNPGGIGALGHAAGAAQGGGGGGGGVYDQTLTPNGGSAGGGCGGCGGAGAASGGSPGGSSIALVVVTSTVTVDTCTLTAAAGGAGGQGGNGLPGQSGGAAGSPAAAGCAGGSGGIGGTGGAGGGGAGGHSIGIAYTGTAPTQSGTVNITVATTPSSGGAPGTGVSSATSPGSPGLNVKTQSF